MRSGRGGCVPPGKQGRRSCGASGASGPRLGPQRALSCRNPTGSRKHFWWPRLLQRQAGLLAKAGDKPEHHPRKSESHALVSPGHSPSPCPLPSIAFPSFPLSVETATHADGWLRWSSPPGTQDISVSGWAIALILWLKMVGKKNPAQSLKPVLLQHQRPGDVRADYLPQINK